MQNKPLIRICSKTGPAKVAIFLSNLATLTRLNRDLLNKSRLFKFKVILQTSVRGKIFRVGMIGSSLGLPWNFLKSASHAVFLIDRKSDIMFFGNSAQDVWQPLSTICHLLNAQFLTFLVNPNT